MASRREFLAVLAAGTAGCSSTNPESTRTESQTSTESPSPTESSTSTPTETPTATEEPIETRDWPDAYYQGPLFSAHEHMVGSDGFSVANNRLDWYLDWMDRNRLVGAMAITPDPLIETVAAHDDRLVPFAFGFNELLDEFDTAVESFEQRLAEYPYEGIGELRPPYDMIDDPPAMDHETLLGVYDLAAEKDVPVMLHGPEVHQHSDEQLESAEEPLDFPKWQNLESAYAHNRDTSFLVHSTYNWEEMTDGEIAAGVLDRNPNVTYDLSGREITPYAYEDEAMTEQQFSELLEETGVEEHADAFYEEHATILEEYSDRLTWGMDAGHEWHFTNWALDAWVDVARAVLGKLPEADARDIGYRNAADLFNVEVDGR